MYNNEKTIKTVHFIRLKIEQCAKTDDKFEIKRSSFNINILLNISIV